jgi:mono/diheme cytochrome c family protein
LIGLALAGSLGLGGCARDGHFSPLDMWNRSRYKPLEPSPFFRDGSSSQPLVPGTVWRGQTEDDKLYPPGEAGGTASATGGILNEAGRSMTGGHIPASELAQEIVPVPARPVEYKQPFIIQGPGSLVKKFPFPVTREVVERGQVQFNIYCAPCHGPTGEGDGMIVQRGFPKPPNYHDPRLVTAPVGHFFDVITNGYGAMFSYASRVSPHDRWAIVAYIRALQASKAAAGQAAMSKTAPVSSSMSFAP